MKYNDSLPLDFGYDPVFFGPHTFVHPPGSSVPNASTTGVVDLLAHFRDALGVRFAGIRKPRTYSNMAFSNASGWLLPNNFSVGAGPENWNMTPGNGWEEWWVARTDHFLRDGIGFWWNDEGACLSFCARRCSSLSCLPLSHTGGWCLGGWVQALPLYRPLAYLIPFMSVALFTATCSVLATTSELPALAVISAALGQRRCFTHASAVSHLLPLPRPPTPPQARRSTIR